MTMSLCLLCRQRRNLLLQFCKLLLQLGDLVLPLAVWSAQGLA